MNNLQNLAEWNTAQAETLEAMSDDLNVDVEVLNHRQNAAIATLLDRVRSECLIEYPSLANPAYEDGPALSTMLTIDGPPDLLRQLAERLGVPK